MFDGDKKYVAHIAGVTQVLEGSGVASPAERRAAFDNAELTGALGRLIDKVARQPSRITDADIAGVKASGRSEDQIFELVVCAALGVAAVLSDLETAPIEEPLRATLRMLGRLTREHAVTADDMRAVLAAGATSRQVGDALAVCCAFNTTNRLADAFGFLVLSPNDFQAGARFLLRRGYR